LGTQLYRGWWLFLREPRNTPPGKSNLSSCPPRSSSTNPIGWYHVLWEPFSTHTIPYITAYRKSSQQSSWTAWSLKMAPIGCPETLVASYQSTLRKIPEEQSLNVLCVVQDKLCVLFLVCVKGEVTKTSSVRYLFHWYMTVFLHDPPHPRAAQWWRLLQLGTNVKFSSRYVLGPCISAHSRTAISTNSLWDVPVRSLVCSSVGFCRWDITNGIIRTVEFVHRLWF